MAVASSAYPSHVTLICLNGRAERHSIYISSSKSQRTNGTCSSYFKPSVTMSLSHCFLFVAAVSCLLTETAATPIFPRSDAPPIVNLGYSQYEGTTLSSKVNQYLGLRFAAPPVGNLRFRAPQDPVATTGIQEAKTVSTIISHMIFVLISP